MCRLLYRSDGFQVDFLAENKSLWHLTPHLPEDSTSHHTVMESLDHLLGNGVEISDMDKYLPRERLELSYLLANSMLFFYPGSWFQAAWSSTKVYFVRRTNSTHQSPSSALLSALTLPYLSVELQQAQQQKLPKHKCQYQYHPHPAILALGIILLEIATGTRFIRSQEAEVWEAVNKDGLKAWETFQALEKQSTRDLSKRISAPLSRAIRSCLYMKPPPDLPNMRLAQEGPIRHYILSCVVQPLAIELRDGHKVRLEDLDQIITPEKVSNGNSQSVEQQRREWMAQSRSSTPNVDEAFAQTNGKMIFTLDDKVTYVLTAAQRTSKPRPEQDARFASMRTIGTLKL